MIKKEKLSFSSKAVHIGNEPDSKTGAVIPPLFATSTYLQDGVGQDRGYDYSRASNPTRHMHEKNIAALENGRYGISFSSGMAATTALFQTFDAGDHFIVSRNTYGGTYRLLEKVFKRHGFDIDFVDTKELEIVEQSITTNTKMVFVETPTNPLLEITDLQSLSEMCKSKNILFGVDNTFMSPYGQRPLDLGADVVMHSSTKFIGGHSDLIGGVLITSNNNLAEKLYFIQKSVGAIPSAFDCWLLLRSTKTLALRVQRQCDTAMKLAQWLEKQKIDRVIYPGLESFPQYELATNQQLTPDGNPIFGSIISIDLGSVQARDKFLSKLNVFLLAESLGGVESLISNPFNMTHGDVPEERKIDLSITEGLIRLSVGIEDFSDLKNDLMNAL
jgi:cystathionine beta-lyase/cystathionine gamma-synthase